MKSKNKRCRCNIRGIVSIIVAKRDLNYLVDPYDYERTFRNFKYCPLCGVKFRPSFKKERK